MATLLKFVLPMLAVIGFTIAFLTAGIGLAELNNSPISIAQDTELAQLNNDLNNTAIDISNDANIAESAIGNSTITVGSSSNIVDSSRGIWKIISDVPKTAYTLISGVIFTKLSGRIEVAIILGIIGAMLVIILVVAVIKLISQGEGG